MRLGFELGLSLEFRWAGFAMTPSFFVLQCVVN